MRAASTEPRLKLYDPENRVAEAPHMKRVRLKQIISVLAEAAKSDRTWLSDFADDEIKISADLYEVLSLYRGSVRARNREPIISPPGLPRWFNGFCTTDPRFDSSSAESVEPPG